MYINTLFLNEFLPKGDGLLGNAFLAVRYPGPWSWKILMCWYLSCRNFIEVCLFFELVYDTYRTYLQIRVAMLTVDGNEEIFELPQYVDSVEKYQVTGSVMDPPPPYKGWNMKNIFLHIIILWNINAYFFSYMHFIFTSFSKFDWVLFEKIEFHCWHLDFDQFLIGSCKIFEDTTPRYSRTIWDNAMKFSEVDQLTCWSIGPSISTEFGKFSDFLLFRF